MKYIQYYSSVLSAGDLNANSDLFFGFITKASYIIGTF